VKITKSDNKNYFQGSSIIETINCLFKISVEVLYLRVPQVIVITSARILMT
jgi:hypothetical protein